MAKEINKNVSITLSDIHATIYPAIQTNAPTIQGQILELITYLINRNVSTVSIDPDFTTQRIGFSGEFPLWVTYKEGVVAFTTSDATPNIEASPSIGPG